MAITQSNAQKHHSQRFIDIRIAAAAGGGWNVIAMRGDRTLAIQHCHDWHRTERMYARMMSDARQQRIAAA